MEGLSADTVRQADVLPASESETYRWAKAELGEDVARWAVGFAHQMTRSLLDEAATDPGLSIAAVTTRSTEAALLTVLLAIGSGHDDVHTPPEILDGVRLAARQGVSLGTAFRDIWFFHALVLDTLHDAISSALPPGEAIAETRRVTTVLARFTDALLVETSAAYEQESSAWHDRRSARRREIIDEVIVFGRAPTGAEADLGVRFQHHHVAAVLSHPDRETDRESWADAALRWISAHAHRTHADSSLVLHRPDGTVEALWSYDRVPADTGRGHGPEAATPVDVIVAFGLSGQGIRGLRRTVLQARHAARVMGLSNDAVVASYADVALESVLLGDTEAAAEFVQTTLGALGAADSRTTTLRTTLEAYLRHKRSRLAAGKELFLAPNTVAYRVKQAEPLLNPRFADDDITVLIALTLAQKFPRLLT